MIFNFVGKSFQKAARSVYIGLCSLALASCGGGGGSAGTTPGVNPSVVSISLTCSVGASSSTTAASGSCASLSVAPGTAVTISAQALDGNNNPVANVTLGFSSSAGVIAPATSPAVTTTTAPVTATLTTVGVAAPGKIVVTVNGGGKTGQASITIAGSQPAMQLLFSSPTLPSANNASTNVTISAVVVDANDNALSGIPVTFSADSGIIQVTQATTNANGIATAVLGTNGNPTNRTINITANAVTTTGASVSATSSIPVSGTTVSAVTTPSSLTFNVLTQFSFSVQDSSGNAIPNAVVTFTSALGNKVVADSSDAKNSSGALITDVNGKVVLDVTPTVGGTDTITVSSEGASGSVSFTVGSQTLSVTLVDNTTSPSTIVSVSPQPVNEYTSYITNGTTVSGSCVQINANYSVSGVATAGTAYVATSRGKIYTNAGCTSQLTTVSVPFNAGVMQPLYLNSSTAGTATVTISETTGSVAGPVQSASVTFISQLVSGLTPSIIVNAQPSVVSPNTAAAPCTNFSILTATVRDGSSANNLVQGVPVQFTLLSDTSGGYISAPVVLTQSNGQAQTDYCAGTGTSSYDGVQVQAKIQSTVATANYTYPLTVSGQSLFVTLGTGNTLTTLDATSYQQQWAVYVTDSAGNPVPNANVSGTLVATSYTKGQLVITYGFVNNNSTVASLGYWGIVPGPNTTTGNILANGSNTPTDGFTASGQTSTVSTQNIWCPNTDPTGNGVWSANDPIQIHYPTPLPANAPFGAVAGGLYPYVMPGIPGNVTSSGTTDTNGYATLNVTWPKDHSQWTNVVLTATANTQGTNSTASTYYTLPYLASDYVATIPNPPGQTSPYGVNNCATAF